MKTPSPDPGASSNQAPRADSKSLRAHIRAAAAERVRLHAAGARANDAPETLKHAYADSHAFLDRLVDEAALRRLSEGEPDALEYALCFLEVYPLCPDSGFAIRDLVRALRDTRLPDEVTSRLRAALLTILTHPVRDEMKHLRKLALKVADESFVLDLDGLVESADLVTAENARALARYLTLPRPETDGPTSLAFDR